MRLWPRLLLKALSRSVVLLYLGSVCMSVVWAAIRHHMLSLGGMLI